MSLLFLNFAEAKQPVFSENKRTGVVNYGEDNKYPEYLLSLYGKSAKHGAIIRNKVKYIIGNGWKGNDEIVQRVNANELAKRISMDIEIFNGAYIEVIWSTLGRNIVSLKHISFKKVRTNKDNTQFWIKENWSAYNNNEKAEVLNAFKIDSADKKQILFIKEYNPDSEVYPIPGYIGALNYIDADIKVSEHILGNASTGFAPSKLIVLPDGEPSPEDKKGIEKNFSNTFTGAGGKKFILSFVNDVAKAPIVNDLGASDLTKEDFTAVDNLIQGNIYAGHEITSPALFGISIPGKLGASTELKDAYDIFKNTYANSKQQQLEIVFNKLFGLMGAKEKSTIIPTSPITVQFDSSSVLQVAPKEWVLEQLGIDASKFGLSQDGRTLTAINTLSPLVANKVLESMTANEIRALAALMPKEGADNISTEITPPNAGTTNEALRSLTGRQHQELLRIIKQVGNGKLTRNAATVMLRNSLGLSEEDINTMLGIDELPQQLSAQDEVSIYAQYGEQRENFTILSTRSRFSDEEDYQCFADVSKTESNVLDLISKDKRITVEVIAKTLGISKDRVKGIISAVDAKGLIKTTEVKQGVGANSNIIIERVLTQPLGKIVEDVKPKTTAYLLKYSYEWLPEVPVSQRDSASHPSRDFCRELIKLDKLYSRADIEQISARLGYSVFDRRGGWWNDNGDTKPHCRHRWVSQVVIKK